MVLTPFDVFAYRFARNNNRNHSQMLSPAILNIVLNANCLLISHSIGTSTILKPILWRFASISTSKINPFASQDFVPSASSASLRKSLIPVCVSTWTPKRNRNHIRVTLVIIFRRKGEWVIRFEPTTTSKSSRNGRSLKSIRAGISPSPSRKATCSPWQCLNASRIAHPLPLLSESFEIIISQRGKRPSTSAINSWIVAS